MLKRLVTREVWSFTRSKSNVISFKIGNRLIGKAGGGGYDKVNYLMIDYITSLINNDKNKDYLIAKLGVKFTISNTNNNLCLGWLSTTKLLDMYSYAYNLYYIESEVNGIYIINFIDGVNNEV